MKINFKKIRLMLKLTGLLVGVLFDPNTVQAMDASLRSMLQAGLNDSVQLEQNSILLLKHRELADKWMNSGMLDQVLSAGARYYGGAVLELRDLNLACIYFESAAKKNNDISKFFLNQIKKEKESCIIPLIFDERIKELLNGVAVGNIVMQYNLANAYYAGNGLPKDYEAALFWAEKVSSCIILENHEQQQLLESQCLAQSLVASMYDRGEGVDCDSQKAFKYFKLSADNPYASSNVFYVVGMKYLKGVGVDLDINLAMKYLDAAKDKGHQGAKRKLDDITNLKTTLRQISIEKSKDDKKSLERQGKYFYESYTNLFNKLKNVEYKKDNPINDTIDICSSFLVIAVECDNFGAKYFNDIILKSVSFPKLDQKYFDIFKNDLLHNKISINNMKKIILLEDVSSRTHLSVQKPNNTSSTTKNIPNKQHTNNNNGQPVNNGQHTNHNNTTNTLGKIKSQNISMNQAKMSVNTSKEIKEEITRTKKELNQRKTTKKLLKSQLFQLKKELNQEECSIKSQESKLAESMTSRNELEKKAAEVKKEKENLISEIEKLKVENLVDVIYEVQTSSIVKESERNEPVQNHYFSRAPITNNSPINNELSGIKSEEKNEEKLLENPQALQNINLDKVEKKEIVEQQNIFNTKPDKKQSAIKTLKTKVKKWNDNREEKSKKHEEKKELKRSKTKKNLSPVKSENMDDAMGDKSSYVSSSVSQTIDESSFTVTENESQFSVTEASEAEKFLSDEGQIICDEMKKAYPKLFRILNKRDVSSLNLIKLKNSTIIYDTLLKMCNQGIICGSWDGKNIHIQKKNYQDIVFNAHTTHGSSGYDKWYHNPEIIIKFITFIADCDDTIKAYCLWKFGESCFSRLSDDSAESANTSKPE